MIWVKIPMSLFLCLGIFFTSYFSDLRSIIAFFNIFHVSKKNSDIYFFSYEVCIARATEHWNKEYQRLRLSTQGHQHFSRSLSQKWSLGGDWPAHESLWGIKLLHVRLGVIMLAKLLNTTENTADIMIWVKIPMSLSLCFGNFFYFIFQWCKKHYSIFRYFFSFIF